MSKQIKQLEMDALKKTFEGVRDMVAFSIIKLVCHLNDQMRAGLRKKNIRLQMVKNSLARRVFGDLGINAQAEAFWAGTTVLAWGSNSLAELSKEIEALARKNDKILKVKGAVSEGQEIPFQVALKMPTRTEAIGRVIGLALNPASRLVGQLLAPGGNLAGQIKSLSEKAPPEAAPGEAAPAAVG